MKERILLVEPDPDLAKSLEVLLRSFVGSDVVDCLSSGYEALQKMSTNHVDIVVLDLSLSDINGVVLARWIARLFPETTLVLLSAYDYPEYRATAARLKAVFVGKAELYRKLPQALASLRREETA